MRNPLTNIRAASKTAWHARRHGRIDPDLAHLHPVRWPIAAQIAAALLLAVGIAGAVGWLLWTVLGRPQLNGNELPTSSIFDGIKIALTVVAGIGGVTALVLAYRRQRFAERQHVREEEAETRQDTKLFNERFTTASEQLGSEKAAVRLAGVYAMGKLADDWPEGRQIGIDVLCAYLRMPYAPTEPWLPDDQDPPKEHKLEERATRQEQQVRHTIIRVIAAHLQPNATPSWQGHEFDFTGATFDGGSFQGATFLKGRLIFDEAKFLVGQAFFHEVAFGGAHVTFGAAKFFSDVAFDRSVFARWRNQLWSCEVLRRHDQF